MIMNIRNYHWKHRVEDALPARYSVLRKHVIAANILVITKLISSKIMITGHNTG